MKYLNEDSLTGGILSQLICDTWEANSRGEARFVTMRELTAIHEALQRFSSSEIFGKIARSVHITSDILWVNRQPGQPVVTGLQKARKTSGSLLESENIEFFDEPGFILYDGMHASAFGHFNYIYRAKGIRLLWFYSGVIGAYSIEAIIDEQGFGYSTEEIDSLDLRQDDYTKLYQYVANGEFRTRQVDYQTSGDAYFWIENLANINIQYDRAYFLEYFIDPPDVHERCAFSKAIRRDLWHTILDYIRGYLDDDGGAESAELLEFSISFMGLVNLEPSTENLLSLFRVLMESQAPNDDKYEILALLEKLYHQGLYVSEKLDDVEGSVLSVKGDTGFLVATLNELRLSIAMLRDKLREESIEIDEFCNRVAEMTHLRLSGTSFREVERRLLREHGYLSKMFMDEAASKYKSFLLTAEYLHQEYLSKGLQVDGSVIVIEYVKVVENILQDHLAAPMIDHFRAKDRHWRGFDSQSHSRPVVPNTLGAWQYLAGGPCKEYERWVQMHFIEDQTLIDFLVNELAEHTEKIRTTRNGAAHDSLYGLNQVDEIKNVLLTTRDSEGRTLMHRLVRLLYYPMSVRER